MPHDIVLEMDATLTNEDVELLLESLDYSKNNVSEGDAPRDLKHDKLEHIAAVRDKLRALRDEQAS